MAITPVGADLPALAGILAAAGRHVPPLMDGVEARLAQLAAGHGDLLAQHAGETIAAGGKRLRPLLVFVAAGEPRGDTAGVVRAAVAVELIHSATLVHDDVLDRAHLRRGRPTVVATAGRGAATATGDLLFSRAFAELTANRREDELRVLSAATSALAEGELRQRADAWDAGVTVERYLARCELKTARLFEAACELGALEARRARLRPGGLRTAHRPGLPAARRRAGRVRAPGADGQAPWHRPPRRDRDPAVHPGPGVRPRAERAGPADDPHARRRRSRLRPHRRHRRAGRRARARPGDRLRGEGGAAPARSPRAAEALELVADGVADRYA